MNKETLILIKTNCMQTAMELLKAEGTYINKEKLFQYYKDLLSLILDN